MLANFTGVGAAVVPLWRISGAPAAAADMTYGLKQGEVAVWWMALKSPPTNVIARWYACLGELERVQAERFHFREDRETYIAAHWMVRTALSSVGGLPPREWRFTAGKFGKP